MDERTGLAEGQLRTLDRLTGIPEFEGYYLGGGSAVAFHLNHRRSLDLDLFSSGPGDLERVRAAFVSSFERVRVVVTGAASLRLVVGTTPVDVVSYPYGPLDPPGPGPAGFPVAGLRDLAAMKLAAIARRGLRRDFWDLQAISEFGGLCLVEAGRSYLARYGLAEPDLYHVARALTWFRDAEADPVFPEGLTESRWERIKVFFETNSPLLVSA